MMQPNLKSNAIAFMQKRYQQATVINDEVSFINKKTGDLEFVIWPMIIQDPNLGVKQRVVAINNLGEANNTRLISSSIKEIFESLDSGLFVKFNNLNPKGHPIDSTQMTFAPRIIIYTNNVHASHEEIMGIFQKDGYMIDIIEEGNMFRTLFISYGGIDESSASSINKYLKLRGIKTWFFPDDSLPGQKLHRMMHDGVNTHDRVLLICSKSSLARPGVLNEIERVLEREAKEGGSDVLIPITLDDYVYEDWAPTRRDLADQLRSRVITKIELQNKDDSKGQLEKLVKVLSRKNS